VADLVPGRRAAIDIGTVSTRLLIADVDPSSVASVDRRSVITHLGEDVARTGSLSPEAVERTLAVVGEYARAAEDAGASSISVIATSAARDADDDGFMARLEALGLEPRIISGPEEALLSFTGATYSTTGEGVLVVDLGGGSTELILGSVEGAEDGGEVHVDVSRSVDVGSRRVSDMFLDSDPPSAQQLADASSWVVDELRPFFDGLKARPRRMVSLAGTATSLSAVHQGLDPYDPGKVHGSVLSGADLADLREQLAGLDLASRREVVGLDPARAEVVVGGVLVLEAILGLAGLDSTMVSEHDILYGLVLEGR
jgi:exopolyphosphatase/guanosine-5'-triphosphate,3'-diphosphate pyrophosphatase